MNKYITHTLILMLAVKFAGASFEYTNGTFTEDFNSLNSDITSNETSRQPIPGTGVVGFQAPVPCLPNWQTARLGGSASTDVEIWAGDTFIGSRIHSRGNGTSTERALGHIGASNYWGSIGTSFVNTSGEVLTQITISYTSEIWAVQGTTGTTHSEHRLEFSYGFSNESISDTDYLSNASMTQLPDLDAISGEENTIISATSSSNPDRNRDGNAAEWQEFLTATVGVNWLPGETLFIRWNGSDGGGNDALLAIDDFSMTAVIPEASHAALAFGLLSLVILALRRSRN